LKGVSERIRFQGQKSNRKGDTEMQGKFLRLYRGFIQEIDARVNDETMDRYGIERQSLVAMEELSELQKAISKLVRNPEEKTKPLEFKGLRDNLIEEMADVIICMDQLKEFYGIDHSDIQSVIDSKQTRQRRRLVEE
jgi:NTP pyrophosphatase (non-canonical NTP hydrolase)